MTLKARNAGKLNILWNSQVAYWSNMKTFGIVRGRCSTLSTTFNLHLCRCVDLPSLMITRQYDRRVSNGMAAVSLEDTTPQSLANGHCSMGACKTWTQSEFCIWQLYSVLAQDTAKHHVKFGWPPLSDVGAVTLPRREIRWNLLGCPKLANWSQPLVGWSSPCGGDIAI